MGHWGLLLGRKGMKLTYFLKAAEIRRENTVIHWQLLKPNHTPWLSPRLPFKLRFKLRFAPQVKSSHQLPASPYQWTHFICQKRRVFSSGSLWGYYSSSPGKMQQFIQINSVEIIHGWSHGVLAPYFSRKTRFICLPEGNMKDPERGGESGMELRRVREYNRRTLIIWRTRRHLNLQVRANKMYQLYII